jgi:hypothetical protein
MRMHPRLEELVRHLDTTRAELRAAIDSVPAERRATAPASGGWSVVGVMEHLAVMEPRATAMIAQKVDEAKAAGLGRETDTSPILPGLGIDRVLDRTMKIEAPDAIQPRGEMDADSAWASLETSRAALKQVIANADGLALNEVSEPHRLFGPLTVYQWIGFVGAHEARHAAQIREIGASLAGG